MKEVLTKKETNLVHCAWGSHTFLNFNTLEQNNVRRRNNDWWQRHVGKQGTPWNSTSTHKMEMAAVSGFGPWVANDDSELRSQVRSEQIIILELRVEGSNKKSQILRRRRSTFLDTVTYQLSRTVFVKNMSIPRKYISSDALKTEPTQLASELAIFECPHFLTYNDNIFLLIGDRFEVIR